MRVILCDTSEQLCSLWLKSVPQLLLKTNKIQVHTGTFELLTNQLFKETNSELRQNLDRNASPSYQQIYAVVSPGNSFGFLGGGFDLALYRYFGEKQFESWFRDQLNKQYKPVGSVTLIDTNGYNKNNIPNRIRYILHIPTMVAPSHPIFSDSEPLKTGYEPIFNATWNALSNIPANVDTLILPGICTGYAGVPGEICSKSMIFALSLKFLSNQLHRDLQNLLIQFYLGYRYDIFFFDCYKDELAKLGIEERTLRSYDATLDPISSILPMTLLE